MLIFQSAAAAFSAATVLVRSIGIKLLSFIDSAFSSQTKFIIAEQDSFIASETYIFQAAEIYLRTKIHNNNNDQVIADEFETVRLQWRLISTEENNNRRFELTFPTKFKNLISDSYIPYFMATAEDQIAETSTNQDRNFNDPEITFDTLEISPEVLKQSIIDDLDLFVRRRDIYRKTGKPWKRGYLLSGNYKSSSIVAAMANHLGFDEFHFRISDIYSNSDLRRIMLSTSNGSILLVVDMDVNAYRHSSQFSLSGILNLIHALWSSCGDGRIIIFTTYRTERDRLHPALLRSGWMDVHINGPQMIKMFNC